MPIKRYQVFLSSTYADLKDERRGVTQAIMQLDCIPAGMEMFPATNEEQFDFIRRIIDDSDYYVLIIGGRYGQITAEGISYTEKEYDYALTKGMEICSFVHSDPGKIAAEKSESDPAVRKKLDEFKAKVKSGRLVKMWERPEELSALVVLSLSQAINRRPGICWVRGSNQTSPEVMNELLTLRAENAELRALSVESASVGIDTNINIKYVPPDTYRSYGDSTKYKSQSLPISKIFLTIGHHLRNNVRQIPYDEIAKLLDSAKSTSYSSPKITEQSQDDISLSLEALDLIKPQTDHNTLGRNAYYSLTDHGLRTLFTLIVQQK